MVQAMLKCFPIGKTELEKIPLNIKRILIYIQLGGMLDERRRQSLS